MFIELVDLLRCPRPHELAWLVLASYRTADRDVVDGALGCSVCGARYPIERGVADLRGDEAGVGAPAAAASDEETAVRAAALLGLAEPGGVAVLTGTWSAAAPDVARLVERVHILAIDAGEALASGSGVSPVRAGARLPLRPTVVRGIALDAAHADAAMLASAVAALQPGGRLVAPAPAPVPDAVRELARDAEHWVGEKQAAPGPVVQLRVARGGGTR